MTDFATFWAAYPRRNTTPTIMGKAKCLHKATALVKSGVTWEELIEGAKLYEQSDSVADGYVQMPMTWLNNGGWEYEYEIPVSEGAVAAKAKPAERTFEQWRLLFGRANDFVREWTLNNWSIYRDGPRPGEPGCFVPREILQEYGFIKVAGE